jgi:hypothetical protein
LDKDEVLVAIDGVIASLLTLKALLKKSDEPVQYEPVGDCKHEKVRSHSTYNGEIMFCNACGFQVG